MDDEHVVIDRSKTSMDDFFHRAGLTLQDRLDCNAFVEQLYPGRFISLASCQGYCSMTVFVGDNLVVQFRPYNYRLDLRIAEAARDVYGSFAPDTKYIATLPSSGLLAFAMNRIEGISFKDFRDKPISIAESTERRATLCRDFASFLSVGWNNSNKASIPLGKVGLSLVSRLKSLSTDLPMRFQSIASHVLRHLHCIEGLPWVLTHGDIVAGNIMVEPSSGHLLGLVDWTEAECLPFGICLYGLEEILGKMTSAGFQYHADANNLRAIFWAELTNQIPGLRQSTLLQAVELARDLGVLLWHGIAFDNGAIDRVVVEGRDVDEIRRLDAFLDLDEQRCLNTVSKI